VADADRIAIGGWVKLGLGLGLLGIAAWFTRWLLQGEAIVYTDVARAFWVADPTLGWVETTDKWVWLGLDGLGLLGGVVLGTAVCALIGRRGALGLPRVARVLSRLGAAVGALGWVIPAWAFVSGMPPAGAQRLLPDAEVIAPNKAANVPPMDVPSGVWKVVENPANTLVARISAGGETFDAKFGPLTGEARIDAASLAKSTASFSAPSPSIETGVELRNNHAKGYLAVDKFPAITLALRGIEAVTGPSPEVRRLSAQAEVGILGKTLTVPVEGSLTVVAQSELVRLGLKAGPVLLVSAAFKVQIAATGLNRANFDADDITINTRFFMAPAP
jgi:polyisoprenoid-binding protein YceI